MLGKKAAIGAAAVLGVAGLALWFALPPRLAEISPGFTEAPVPELIEQGRYIAELGDCVACHTARDGEPMAGGLALESPMGTIYSTNITPDRETGIGEWTFAEFDRAMRQGVAADGHNLYPAMPYPSYARMTDEDMSALWAYMTAGVAPVERANTPTALPFPFSQRWGLSYWNAVFLDDRQFVADPAEDAGWNRGAYLVQSLGHCGACHTPRGLAFQEVTMDEKGRNGADFLAGAQVENWNAVSLRNLWDIPDMVELLRTGQNRFATVSGGMVDVISHSTQHFTEEDLTAMAVYMKSLPYERTEPEVPLTQEELVAAATVPGTTYTTPGGLGYAQFCADCHRLNGQGVPGIFPPFVGNHTISAEDPATLLHITLTGWQTPVTATHPRSFHMPGFARLGDDEIAAILTFVRDNWGGGAGGISTKQVAEARRKLDPSIDDSRFETPRIASMLAEDNAEQLVHGMRLNAETRDLLPENVGNGLNCSSCHLNAGTVADGSPYVGISAFFPSYQKRAGKVISMEERINGCFRRSMNGKPIDPTGDDMKAMLAYFDWMRGETKPEDKVEGRGIGKIDTTLTPDPVRGKEIYAAQCAVCHGADGEGIRDAAGRIIYPALWGAYSFNIGAGMARTNTAAAFVRQNMPIAAHGQFPLGQGGLSDQDALDVAEYFSHMPRPDFPDKVGDWPNDPKPKDSRY
ncbi:thiosulfate dehydrogenase [Amaricoccus macauensis]|uniref:Thiosulfate dehydrogenase n=1 Tax=Amaricoccus macauensis TaxID=57001 RepID=A0A840SV69_9RHOB|nr:c-type cytochrome [Amaricoccus macauensis]MBB5224395.1 thiosulfate dehydrogenase [Amaricoccus macauensis]